MLRFFSKEKLKLNIIKQATYITYCLVPYVYHNSRFLFSILINYCASCYVSIDKNSQTILF